MTRISRTTRIRYLIVALHLVAVAAASAQLRVATWNISSYGGGRVADIQTAVYGVYQGRSLTPDLIVCQEILSASAITALAGILNAAPGSPGDWAAAPFVDGPDTDSACVYRVSKVTLLGVTVVATGGSAPNHPRNIMRYDVRLHGYSSPGATLACYSTHMKSGSSESDQQRRLLEAQRIRDDAELLDPAWHFLLGGDLNAQSSEQPAYQELTGSQANDTGRFFDPINTPGEWNNNPVFCFVDTQDPIGAGGMDDRHDQLLVCGRLVDGDGFDYIGDPATAYSTTTWDDPGHSYRAWGNDGTSFNTTLTITGNEMVGAAIAQALVNVASGAGHLPVFLDLRVPPQVGSDEAIDFGPVEQGGLAEVDLNVWNDGDVVLWKAAGIAELRYTLTTSTGFTVPAGPFAALAGDPVSSHTITMDTSTPGPASGTLIIASNAPDEPSRIVTLTGEVIPPSGRPGDLNCDGVVGFGDINPFILLLCDSSAWQQAHPNCPVLNGDINGNGTVGFDDINPFIALLSGR